MIKVTEKMQGIIGTFFKNLCSTKLENPKEMGEFLHISGLTKKNQNEIDDLNKPTTSNKSEPIIRNLPSKKVKGQNQH